MPRNLRSFLPISPLPHSALYAGRAPLRGRRWLAAFGVVALAVLCGPAQTAPANAFSEGRRVYVEVCAACHANGIAGAPRYGNRQEWEKRLSRSRDELMASVLKGKGSMPPKGGNASVTDVQAAEALEYLLAGVR
jgi:cytochrome c5